jgi:hypothetical protein
MTGGDCWLLLISRDTEILRQTARRLGELGEPEDDENFSTRRDILLNSGVAWISQDWRYWDVEADIGALEHLGWTRTVAGYGEHGFRVTLQPARRR